MVQSVKQCAGCGAQMGARGRVCPRCGRGSLFGELLWIAVLGVLLLGIGVVSGLVPVDRIPGIAWIAPPVQDSLIPPVVPPARQAAPGRREARKAANPQPMARQPSPMGYAPCAGSEAETVMARAMDSSHRGPHTPASVPCGDPADSAPDDEPPDPPTR